MSETMPSTDLTVGGANSSLAERLGQELATFNIAATREDNQRGLSVQINDPQWEISAGLTGWTWGTSAGIELVWVREDQRRKGHGRRLLMAAETEARTRGCQQILVSSFTFQAPSFYKELGYVEFARTEGLPTEGSADVHMVKMLATS
jgi:GNAT superfamily N-acetyltransferase